MAAQHKVGVPIPPKKMERVAELIGMGLSHSETAGAVGISEKSVQRILAKPEYRRMADDVARKRTSVTAQAASVVQELLTAVNSKGLPDMASRQRGAELVMKNPALLEHVEDLEGDDSMLPGVVLRFPWADGSQYSRDSEPGDGTEAISAPQAESENGLALPADAVETFDALRSEPPPDLDRDEEPPTPEKESAPAPVKPQLDIAPPEIKPGLDEQKTVGDLFTEADLA